MYDPNRHYSAHETAEGVRLRESRERTAHWKRWGPYLSERAWGTVREDYSPDGSAWNWLNHEMSRSVAYRWNEDGIAGISDRRQMICFALALWNERDPILKERLFGLTGPEGNHGEDVKEYYFYLDSTPTHSYMKYLYKYPQGEYPYARIVEENRRRSRSEHSFELLDSGLFDENRYFDVYVEYAKASPEDILVLVTLQNRGPEPAPVHLLPTIWFRNNWSWGGFRRSRPRVFRGTIPNGPPGARSYIGVNHHYYHRRRLYVEGEPELLFTENETNRRRVGLKERRKSPYYKDAFHECIVQGIVSACNPEETGTKACAHYQFNLQPGETTTIRLRFCPAQMQEHQQLRGEFFPLGEEFDRVFHQRREEADEFYNQITGPGVSHEQRRIMRQALGGLLWSKQFYHYEVEPWLEGEGSQLPTTPERKRGRNSQWKHLYNADVLMVPDKWEYPWYAAWDLAFHAIPMALVDSDFAKEQLILLLREWYMHPNGQIPAYEWDFNAVNPPLHAWAALRVYQIEKKLRGAGDITFLERVFHKLLLNFTWWVNHKDRMGHNVFEGGFLGLDNIGVFDRNTPFTDGTILEQSDATSWMGMYSLNMLNIALELARHNPAYDDVASKFFEHFVYIAKAMNNMGEDHTALWDEEDGFYYDALRKQNGETIHLKVRSMVGLIPLFAVMAMEAETLDQVPDFRTRMEWFIEHRPELTRNLARMDAPGRAGRRLFSLVNPGRLRRILARMLDESEFLSDYGIRALSRYHREHPYSLQLNDQLHTVCYEPAESSSDMFGGNSNWRGPIWFPLNYLLIESLQRFDAYYGESFQVEFPTGSGKYMNLLEVSQEISRRLVSIFLPNMDGLRPVYGGTEKLQKDPHWNQYILFHEYFHGDNGAGLGASHQTGWTALVAKLIQQTCQ